MPTNLKHTALFDLHQRLGAKMVPFAGYEMPLQYAAGLMAEHLHTRRQVGLFDVSHMGQLDIQAREGGFGAVASALERLIPVDILGLPDGRQRYGFFTLETGGLLDDLMMARRGDGIFMVVNASRKAEDLAHLRAHLDDNIIVTPLDDRALLALQGPMAADVLGPLCPSISEMRFMDVMMCHVRDVPCIVARSGYTGEDGFEISVPADSATLITEAILSDARVLPIGLGARDSLRLEAGLCLYGQDIDETTSPVSASLQWAIQKVRREGAPRAGGFIGADAILPAFSMGATRYRVGLAAQGRAPIRAGVALYASDTRMAQIGTVTSGAFGPSMNAPVAMGYVDPAYCKPGTALFAELRGRMIPVRVADLPFVSPGYKR